MKSRKSNIKPPIFLLLLASIFLVFALSILLIGGILLREYSSWATNFESTLNTSNIVTLENSELKSSVDKKIEVFGKSSKKVDFIEITEKEFMYLLGESIDTSLPLGIRFSKGYVVTDDALWDIYIQTKFKEKELPWVSLKLQKDNTESAQIYVHTTSIGNFDLTDYGAKIVIDRINKGISESLLLVNESEFTGRTFRNIELEVGKMTIKGEK